MIFHSLNERYLEISSPVPLKYYWTMISPVIIHLLAMPLYGLCLNAATVFVLKYGEALIL